MPDRNSNRHRGRSCKHLKWLPLKTVPNRRSTKLWRKTPSLAPNLRNPQFSGTAPSPRKVVFLGFFETLTTGGIESAAAVAEQERFEMLIRQAQSIAVVPARRTVAGDQIGDQKFFYSIFLI